MKELLSRFLPHVSSISLSFGVLIFYILGNHDWVNQYLPANGKPLFIFMLMSIVIVYEIMLSGQKEIRRCLRKTNLDIHDMAVQMEVARLKQNVNSVYFRVKSNNIEIIDNENTIKEINELKDTRVRLGVNSYTQSRLEYLCNLIEL